MGGLPPITTFTVTAGLRHPASHRLAAACAAAGVSSELTEAPGLPHV